MHFLRYIEHWSIVVFVVRHHRYKNSIQASKIVRHQAPPSDRDGHGGPHALHGHGQRPRSQSYRVDGTCHDYYRYGRQSSFSNSCFNPDGQPDQHPQLNDYHVPREPRLEEQR